MGLRELAVQLMHLEKSYWLGLITFEDAVSEVEWLAILLGS